MSLKKFSFSSIEKLFSGNPPIRISEYYRDDPSMSNILLYSGMALIILPPLKGSKISISSFFGKPTTLPLETNYTGTYINTQTLGNAYFVWINGVNIFNRTRPRGMIIKTSSNTIVQNRNINFINYQNLIIQASPGDVLQFIIEIGNENYNYQSILQIYINYGSGYNIVGGSPIAASPNNQPGYNYIVRTLSFSYTIPSNTPLGNYGILFYTTYGFDINYSDYKSCQFYSLHIC